MVMENGHSQYADSAPQPGSSQPLSSFLSSLTARLRGVSTSADPAPQRRAFRRLQSSQPFLPLFIVTVVVTLLAVISTGYIAARASAISSAENIVTANAQVAREVLGERGQYPALVDSQLAMVSGATSYPLVGDTWAVDHVQQLTGDLTVIYQLKDSSLVSVATNIPQTDGQGQAGVDSRALGQAMPAAVQSALLRTCNTISASAAECVGYNGVVSVAGTGYVAGYVPLLDSDGRLVGAVGVMTPLNDVLVAPGQLALLLLLLGLLAGTLALVAGTWVAGRFPNRLLLRLDGQLETMSHAASELGRLAHQQGYRLQQQRRTARQVGEHALKLEALTSTLDSEQIALRQTTTEIWAEMSQPGLAINAQTAIRLAREAAVHSSEVGVAGEATQLHARQVITLMNRVIAEGRALAQEGQEAQAQANAVAATLEHMETELSEQQVSRQYDFSSLPLVRRIAGVSLRLRQMLHAGSSGTTGPRLTGRSFPWTHGPTTHARGALSNLPQHDGSGRVPSASMPRNDALRGFPRLDQTYYQPPANPNGSGSRNGGPGGRRQPGDMPPPGGLPPLGRYDDDSPPRGPNDSHWLNE